MIESDFYFTSSESAEFQFQFGLLLDSDNLTCLVAKKHPMEQIGNAPRDLACAREGSICSGAALQFVLSAVSLVETQLKIKSRRWLSLFH